MLGRAGLSPVEAAPDRGRWLAFALAGLMLVSGLGYVWLGARGSFGPELASAAASSATAPATAANIAPVMDLAGVLSDQTETRLSAKLRALKAELGPQMTVLTVADLGGRSIDEYAFAWFNRVGLGDAKRNDGVLLLIAPNQHRVRIEVGKGLTSVLSNQTSRQIIDQILPLFRAGKIDAATTTGVDSVIEDLRQLKQFHPGKVAE